MPLTDSLAPATLLGVLLCFRHVIPNVGEADEREQTMKGSFGEKTPASGEKGSVSEMIDQSKLLKVRFRQYLWRTYVESFVSQISQSGGMSTTFCGDILPLKSKISNICR